MACSDCVDGVFGADGDSPDFRWDYRKRSLLRTDFAVDQVTGLSPEQPPFVVFAIFWFSDRDDAAERNLLDDRYAGKVLGVLYLDPFPLRYRSKRHDVLRRPLPRHAAKEGYIPPLKFPEPNRKGPARRAHAAGPVTKKRSGSRRNWR